MERRMRRKGKSRSMVSRCWCGGRGSRSGRLCGFLCTFFLFVFGFSLLVVGWLVVGLGGVSEW